MPELSLGWTPHCVCWCATASNSLGDGLVQRLICASPSVGISLAFLPHLQGVAQRVLALLPAPGVMARHDTYLHGQAAIRTRINRLVHHISLSYPFLTSHLLSCAPSQFQLDFSAPTAKVRASSNNQNGDLSRSWNASPDLAPAILHHKTTPTISHNSASECPWIAI